MAPKRVAPRPAGRRPVDYTRQAREDLLDLWEHVAADRSDTVADRILTRIAEACDILRDHPEIGRARPEIAADARALVIERWLALYRLTPDGPQIVRVVDGARDLSRIGFPE